MKIFQTPIEAQDADLPVQVVTGVRVEFEVEVWIELVIEVIVELEIEVGVVIGTVVGEMSVDAVGAVTEVEAIDHLVKEVIEGTGEAGAAG